MTLLPVISKIFCRMLLERIKKGVDKNLRNEQAGFRSTTKQIFILRNILEHRERCFFTCEKKDTSNQKPQRCVKFAPKFPPFLAGC